MMSGDPDDTNTSEQPADGVSSGGGAVAGSWFEGLMLCAGAAWILTSIIAFVQWSSYRGDLGSSGPSNTDDIAGAGHALVIVMPWFVISVALTAFALMSALSRITAGRP